MLVRVYTCVNATLLNIRCHGSNPLIFIGWLEPILSRIKENDTNVIVPVIDVINDETLKFQYMGSGHAAAGGMNWGLIFNWHAVPDAEKRRRNYKDYLPFR